VARTTITSVKSHSLVLSNQPPLDVDAIIFATGWEAPTERLFTLSLKTQLGLPVPWSTLPESVEEYWKSLDASSDREILDIYPIFANPPYKYPQRDTLDTPFRLFRAIVPPKLAAEKDRSIVFLGQLANVQHTSVAEISSLWSVAYLENLLPALPIMSSEETMNREVARVNAFMKRRYPGRKNRPLALLEVRDWMDVLLRDLGLRTDRIKLAVEMEGGWGWWGLKGWWRELFEPYGPVVYKGIVEEFLEGVQGREEEKKIR
jgi:dimethylaniline monooxygenase (N-oxide forming)